MDAVVSDPAAELIDERGGRLYVWLEGSRCCGGVTRLVSASEAPAGKAFAASQAATVSSSICPPG